MSHGCLLLLTRPRVFSLLYPSTAGWEAYSGEVHVEFSDGDCRNEVKTKCVSSYTHRLPGTDLSIVPNTSLPSPYRIEPEDVIVVHARFTEGAPKS